MISQDSNIINLILKSVFYNEPLRFQVVFSEFSLKYRSSPPEVFLGKGVLKICSTFTGEHTCRSAISIKLLKVVINCDLNEI